MKKKQRGGKSRKESGNVCNILRESAAEQGFPNVRKNVTRTSIEIVRILQFLLLQRFLCHRKILSYKLMIYQNQYYDRPQSDVPLMKTASINQEHETL